MALGENGTITWLGHASVLVTTSTGTRVVFDPWLDNPKSPTDVAGVGPVDVIAVTHGHGDHIGSVVELAQATGAAVVCVHELSVYFATQGLENLIGMNKGGTVSVKDVSLTMVGADHSCGVAAGEGLPDAYGGSAAGFVATLPSGGPLYVSGDTNVFSDMAIIRDLYHPHTAMMPIDGHYNMGPREAAYALRLLGVARFIPYHWGTFPMLTGTPDALAPLMDSATILEAIEPGQSAAL